MFPRDFYEFNLDDAEDFGGMPMRGRCRTCEEMYWRDDSDAVDVGRFCSVFCEEAAKESEGE